MAVGTFLEGVFTPRRPKGEPGSVRVNGGRDAIIFRRVKIDDLISSPTTFTTQTLRQSVSPKSFDPIAELLAVEMLINPFKAGFETPRDIQTLPTSALGRYVDQDWGPGRTTIHLECQTGSIIPFSRPPSVGTDLYTPIQSNGLPQVKTFDTQGYLRLPRSTDVGWTTLVLSSERFQNFLALFVVAQDFDGGTEIMLMTFGRAIFRGFIKNFRWELEAEHSWNIKYGFDFEVAAGMGTWTRGIQGDDGTASFLHDVQAADDVPYQSTFDAARVNDSPIVFGRSFYSVDSNGGLSVFDPGSFTSFTDTFKGIVPVSLGG